MLDIYTLVVLFQCIQTLSSSPCVVDANLLFGSSSLEEELSTAQCLSQLLFLLTDDYIEKNLKRHIVSLFFLPFSYKGKTGVKETKHKQTLIVIVSTFFYRSKKTRQQHVVRHFGTEFFFQTDCSF